MRRRGWQIGGGAAALLGVGLAAWLLRGDPEIELRAGAGADTAPAAPPIAPSVPPRIAPGAPDVVLISVDTLRADHLGAYGFARPTSPAIDRLAADGILFEKAFTTAPKTLPGLASLLTGLPVKDHGVYELRIPLEESVPLATQTLQRAGYATAGFCGQFNCQRRWGLARGFDHYVDDFVVTEQGRSTSRAGGGFHPSSEKRAGALVDGAIEWIAGLGRTGDAEPGAAADAPPFFVWLHLMDPHAGYAPPESHRDLFQGSSRFSSLAWHGASVPPELIHSQAKISDVTDYDAYLNRYDAEIRYADDQLARLFAFLRAEGRYENALIVFTADHGEYMGEASGELTYFSHGETLSDTEVRVPLILKLPGGHHAGERRQRPVSIADVGPTLLSLALPGSGADEGRSLTAPDAAEGDPPGIVFFQSPTEQARFSARSDRYKLVFDCGLPSGELIRRLQQGEAVRGRYRLYDLSSDPLEREPIGAGPEQVVATLAGALADWLAQRGTAPGGAAQPEPLDEETAEHLRALGYLE